MRQKDSAKFAQRVRSVHSAYKVETALGRKVNTGVTLGLNLLQLQMST